MLFDEASRIAALSLHREGKHALHTKTVNRGLQNNLLVFKRLYCIGANNCLDSKQAAALMIGRQLPRLKLAMAMLPSNS